MKKISILFGYILLTVFSSHTFAKEYTVSICGIQAESNTNIAYILICKDSKNLKGWISKNGCPYNGFIGWDLSVFQGKSMYAAALTAFSLDKQVNVRLDMDWKACIGTDGFDYDHTKMIRIIK